MNRETTEAATTVPPVPASDSILGAVAAPSGTWPSRHRYALLATAVVVLTAIQTLNGQWSSDMWEHVAVVRELIARPGDPMHPLVLSDAAHPGFSPYTVALGVLGDLTGAGAIAVLSVAAVVNVVLLLLAFRLLVVEVTDNRRAPFWALLFVLVLWGFTPYRYSGFFGLNSIGFVAPFPSTLATAVAFGTLVVACRFARSRQLTLLVPIALGTAFVILVHPLSAPWMLVALLAVAIARLPRPPVVGVVGSRDGRDARAVPPVALLLDRRPPQRVIQPRSVEPEHVHRRAPAPVPRPARPGGDLAPVAGRPSRPPRPVPGRRGGPVARGSDHRQHELRSGAPLRRRRPRHRARPTGWRGSSPRVAGGRRRGPSGSAPVPWPPSCSSASSPPGPGGCGWSPSHSSRPLSATPTSSVRPDEQLAFLTDEVGPTDVVVAARDGDNRVIPALAGRTLALAVPRPFVADADERVEAQHDYLEAATPIARRRQIEDRYDVRFALLQARDERDRALLAVLVDEGATVVYEDDEYVLVSLAGLPDA